ncbi:MAG: 30S ribosomal protein S20 [Candidatus Limnocylindrales bacterium]
MARKPRGWTGARTPSALKRVRTAARRAAVNQPRRSTAKTLVSKAVKVAAGGQPGDPTEALRDALSALDRAAKAGAIHPNAAARRKSRLTRKVNAALGGEHVQTSAKLTKTTGKAAAVKAAKTRIALAKADKAKGAQTAAGKARAALSKTARAEAAATAAAAAAKAETSSSPAAKTAPKATSKTTTKTAAKSPSAKAAPKATAKAAAKPASASAKPTAAKPKATPKTPAEAKPDTK